ncbi:phage NrS-1 polymerase family protein [Halorubrum sp. FL23]|uniref:phage NrS-1 polymerase family protein n=1 Tax=Halorubrum sp. FL23 TaxID=3458704 RepID=UPI0040336952
MKRPIPPREHGVGAVPEPLQERDQWIVTRDKAPKRPVSGWEKPENQLVLNTALRGIKQYAGELAYVLRADDPFVVVDLDDVVPEDSTAISQEATEVVRQLNTYTEWSRSGEGLHLVTEGTHPPERSESELLDDIGKIEMFDRDQYVVLTGDLYNPSGGFTSKRSVRRDAGSVIAKLQDKYLPEQTSHVGSEEVISITESQSAFSVSTGLSVEDVRRTLEEYAKTGSQQAQRTLDRWDSTPNSSGGLASPSEADLGFASDLAFWCKEDAQLIDKCFRHSSRIRSKWDVVHYSDGRTYGNVTIQKAIKTNGSTFSGRYVTR